MFEEELHYRYSVWRHPSALLNGILLFLRCISCSRRSTNEIIPCRCFFSARWIKWNALWSAEQWNLNASEKCIEKFKIFFFRHRSSLKMHRIDIARFPLFIASFHYLHIASVVAAGAGALINLCAYMRLTENLNCNLIIHSHSQWVVGSILAYNTALELLTEKKEVFGRRWKKKSRDVDLTKCWIMAYRLAVFGCRQSEFIN